MKGALPYPFYGLEAAVLPGIERVSVGSPGPTPFNPVMPVKLWRDTRPNLPTLVQYRVAQVLAGIGATQKAVLVPLSLSRAWAQSLNVPYEMATEGPPGEPELPFPLREFFEDEELAMNPWGIGPVIRNRELYAAFVGGSPSGQDSPAVAEILAIVKDIQTRLIKGGL